MSASAYGKEPLRSARTANPLPRCSRDELIRRLTVRSAALPDHSFAVNIADLEGWIALFVPPTADELE
jgi:hypothetical protein